MDNKQKIMSDLEGLTFDDWHMYHSDTEVQGIAIDALELLKKQTQWISVKDRMPAETHSMFFKLYGTPMKSSLIMR